MAAHLRLVAPVQHIPHTDEAERLLRPVRLAVYQYDPTEFSKKIGVSPATVMAFRSGRTKWPRPATLFAILRETGYTIQIVKAP